MRVVRKIFILTLIMAIICSSIPCANALAKSAKINSNKTRKASKVKYVKLSKKYKLRPGMGLSAVQLGILKRYFVVVHEQEVKETFKTYVIINPKITSNSQEIIYVDEGEGCLSVNRDVEGIVKRYARCTVEGFDMDGNPIKIRAREELSVAFQHEIDHLNGILVYDKIDKNDPFKDADLYRSI